MSNEDAVSLLDGDNFKKDETTRRVDDYIRRNLDKEFVNGVYQNGVMLNRAKQGDTLNANNGIGIHPNFWPQDNWNSQPQMNSMPPQIMP
jgi:hypothetical protein